MAREARRSRYVVLEREAASFFLRTKQAAFPGKQIAELFQIGDGPAAASRSTATSSTSTATTTGACATSSTRRSRRAPPTAGARSCASFIDELVAARRRSDFVATRLQAVPGADDRDGHGRAARGRRRAWRSGRTGSSASSTGRRCSTERDRVERACAELYDYLHALLAEKRATPGDDLISTLIADEQDGDRLSDVELVNLVLNVLVGGVDTTQSQLAHIVRLLAEHPDQWELVRARPRDVRAARGRGGAALRADHAVHRAHHGRGRRVPRRRRSRRGRSCSSPRSPPTARASRTASASTSTVERDGAKPLTFGAGIHYCLGANLARAEMQEALAAPRGARSRAIELDGEPEFDSIPGIYGMTALPVVLA